MGSSRKDPNRKQGVEADLCAYQGASARAVFLPHMAYTSFGEGPMHRSSSYLSQIIIEIGMAAENMVLRRLFVFSNEPIVNTLV